MPSRGPLPWQKEVLVLIPPGMEPVDQAEFVPRHAVADLPPRGPTARSRWGQAETVAFARIEEDEAAPASVSSTSHARDPRGHNQRSRRQRPEWVDLVPAEGPPAEPSGRAADPPPLSRSHMEQLEAVNPTFPTTDAVVCPETLPMPRPVPPRPSSEAALRSHQAVDFVGDFETLLAQGRELQQRRVQARAATATAASDDALTPPRQIRAASAGGFDSDLGSVMSQGRQLARERELLRALRFASTVEASPDSPAAQMRSRQPPGPDFPDFGATLAEGRTRELQRERARRESFGGGVAEPPPPRRQSELATPSDFGGDLASVLASGRRPQGHGGVANPSAGGSDPAGRGGGRTREVQRADDWGGDLSAVLSRRPQRGTHLAGPLASNRRVRGNERGGGGGVGGGGMAMAEEELTYDNLLRLDERVVRRQKAKKPKKLVRATKEMGGEACSICLVRGGGGRRG
jgi:hypothetical protein